MITRPSGALLCVLSGRLLLVTARSTGARELLCTNRCGYWSWIPTPRCGPRCGWLELEDGVRVAGEAGDMLTGLRVAADAGVAVVLVDSRLVELSLAVDALKALARRIPLVVMGTGDPALYAAPYVAVGASGYWAKDGDLPALVGLLRAAVVCVRPPSG